MHISTFNTTVGEVSAGFVDSDEEGVVGFEGSLNIRPKYQREFIYREKQRDAVIRTIIGGFPLNTMYWVGSGNGSYELLDGQQRTISFCQYVSGGFAVDHRYFHNLSEEEKQAILDYKLMVYVCEGVDSEKLDWFRTINIACMPLTEQELRNAIYAGPWLTDAKKDFSKRGCRASEVASKYLTGSPIRQDYLERVLDWISDGSIEEYMSKHQHDEDALELWHYFEKVINWVNKTIPNYRKEMKGVPWGTLYNAYHKEKFDTKALEDEITALMRDEDVTNKSGIYSYIFTKERKSLNIRRFTDNQKREAFERQGGVCPSCEGTFDISDMEGDHITPWHEGGKTTAENCRMLCKACNRTKAGK